MLMVWLFFCVKQKTAYEMRISDWSSDVCSSDLEHVAQGVDGFVAAHGVVEHVAEVQPHLRRHERAGGSNQLREHVLKRRHGQAHVGQLALEVVQTHHRAAVEVLGEDVLRSEEHTSELQSLMRISYAVFCMKKKTQ